MLAIRPATPADAPTILRFIHELAEYEREPDKVIATEADLLRDGFCLAPDGTSLPTPARFRALIADWTATPSTTPEPAGFALFFTSYSTWLGHHGIRLEDLYVPPPPTPRLRHRQGSSRHPRPHRRRRGLRPLGVGRSYLE